MRRLVLLLVVAATVVLPACGGDDQLSREEYTREANEICDRFDDRLQEAEQQLDEAETPDQLARAIDDVLPTVREAFDEIEQLDPPDELQADVDEWNRLNDEAISQLEQLRDAAAAGDEQRLESIAEQLGENGERSDEIVRRVGADRCTDDD